jgi:glycine C-acetyltransferase
MRPVISARGRSGRVTLDGVDTLMLGSNDYLGLSSDERVLQATSAALREYGTGTCLYPVFATTAVHEELSNALVSFLGVEAVALFSSGGTANAGVLATLVEAGDVIVSDRLNHASIVDGCRLSRADVIAYSNRNVEELRQALEKTTGARRKLVITDGIFSMEGGTAPLCEIYALARAHDALLVVDEAHALGVVGPGGTGTAPLLGLSNNAAGLVLTGSLSKAIGGASGGFVAGPHDIVERLKARCRSWIFTMGMTTANAATALAAVNIVRTDPSRMARLWANIAHLRNTIRSCDLEIYDSDSAITALRVGDEDRARHVAAEWRRQGAYAPAVAYPVVARGEARLRLQVSAAHETEDLTEAIKSLAIVMRA